MSYKQLGEYIQPINIRITHLRTLNLLGVNIDKYFMPSVANIVGTDLLKYKVLRKGLFACNPMHVGRDYRMPTALYTSNDEAIVSPAYFTFEVIDESEVLPEYLMLWFMRPEFDRNCWFYTDGTVRGGITWDDICRLPVNIPSIDKQKEIVWQYKTVANAIDIKKQINQKLEETAMAVFKEWFGDKEPNGVLTDIAEYMNGLAMQNYRPSENERSIPVMKIKELRQGNCDDASEVCSVNVPKKYIINNGDIIFSWSGTLYLDLWGGEKCGLNQHLFKVTSSKYEKWFYYLWTNLHLQYFISIAAGKATTMGHIKKEHLETASIYIPSEEEYQKANKTLKPLFDSLICNKIQGQKLQSLQSLLLSRLAKEATNV